MNIQEKIINIIKLNRISSTEVADALGKRGIIDIRLKPITKLNFAVGIVRYIPTFNSSNWHLHRLIENISSGEIALIEAINCQNRAMFGELVAKYALLYRQAAGIVALGFVRDVPHLIKERYSIWAFGGNPVGCFNEDLGFDEELYRQKKIEYDQSIIVADDTGCIIIKAEEQTEALYKKLIQIERQEDVWFDAIDRMKLSTFQAVCLKQYEM
jgi:regulator of RNase E activity RraA